MSTPDPFYPAEFGMRPGVSRRDMFALRLFCAARSRPSGDVPKSSEEAAKVAVADADALLKELTR